MNFRKIYESVKLSEDKADEEFNQIYNDLTDAHGYLTDPDNSRQYKKLGYEVEEIKDRLEKYYKFKNILSESMSEEQVEEYFGDWDPLERDWKVSPNPDDYDSVLHEYAEKWLNKFNLNEEEKKDIASAICNAFWNGNSRGHKNAMNSWKEAGYSIDLLRN
jgi:nitrogenase molybdenum-iron protein alpha/beta subunit